jgi:cytidyltransferase-like protein
MVTVHSENDEPTRESRSLDSRALRVLDSTATFSDRFVSDLAEAVELSRRLRELGCVIALVTGVWDLFHVGHATYLRKGKEIAASIYSNSKRVILVVGVDTDERTSWRKGDKRPILAEYHRWTLLGEVRPVDLIVPQSRLNELYQVLPHEVHIISQTTLDVPSHEQLRKYCEHLVILPSQSEVTTTGIVSRIVETDGSRSE